MALSLDIGSSPVGACADSGPRFRLDVVDLHENLVVGVVSRPSRAQAQGAPPTPTNLRRAPLAVAASGHVFRGPINRRAAS